MDAAPYRGHEPEEAPPRLLAALHPRMLALARERTAGTITYLVPPEHTALARDRLGPEGFVAVEQAFVLDGNGARDAARPFVDFYVKADDYRRNLLRLGFAAAELDSLDDRLVDALVVHGDEAAVAASVGEHVAAGADHVCVQALPNDDPQLERLRGVAPALVGL
jgi:probable F420-dependent oxidoreductase